MISALISAAELKNVLQQPNVRVLDASYNMPPSATGIPGAIDFDIDDVADKKSPFPRTVPSAEVFAEKVGKMGVGTDDTVIIYDRNGIAMAAARAWWMFRLFGHDKVRVLNGGLPAWISAGYAMGEKAALPTPTSFKAKPRPELLKKIDQMAENVTNKSFTVFDARDSARFQKGHIPGACNIPYADLINTDGTLKSKDELTKIFSNLPNKIASSCGSGVTACVIALALHEIGRPDVAVYDGSWTEWSAAAELPKAEGF